VTTARPAPAGYRDVLRDREYRAILVTDGLSVVGDQVTRLAVALLVLDRTGSAFLAAATYACSYLSWLLGGPVLTALADRLPRRRLMVGCDLARAVLVLVLLVPGLPLAGVFAVLLAAGLLAPPSDAARSALLADVLEGERYVRGNALSINLGQAGQVVGFLLGGALVALLGTRGALLVDALTFLLSAALIAALVRDRPAPAVEATPGLRAELSAGLRLVLGDPELRRLLGWGGLVAAVTIAPEGLAVAVAAELGGGPASAGLLTAAVPAGFLVGSAVVLRAAPGRRRRLFPWLTLLSALALTATPLLDAVWAVAALWAVAGFGGALQVVANAAFVQAVPAHLRGRAFGVAGTVLMATQGVVLLLAGALADQVGAQVGVALVAAAGLGALLLACSIRPVRTPSGRRAAGRGRAG
jgi:MFS family permease